MIKEIKTVFDFVQALADDCGLEFVRENLSNLLLKGEDTGFTIGLMPVEFVSHYNLDGYNTDRTILKIGEYHVELLFGVIYENKKDTISFDYFSSFQIVKPVKHVVLDYSPVYYD